MANKNTNAEVRGLGALKTSRSNQRALNSDQPANSQDFARRITRSEFSTRKTPSRAPGIKLSNFDLRDDRRAAEYRPAKADGLTDAERWLLYVMYFSPFQRTKMRDRAGRLRLQHQSLRPSFADIHWENLIKFWEQNAHVSQATAQRRALKHIKSLAKAETAQWWGVLDRTARKSTASPVSVDDGWVDWPPSDSAVGGLQ